MAMISDLTGSKQAEQQRRDAGSSTENRTPRPGKKAAGKKAAAKKARRL
jgi:hypothetical protein